MAGLLLLVFLAVADLFYLCIVIPILVNGIQGNKGFGCGVVMHRGGDNSLRRFLSKREPFALIGFSYSPTWTARACWQLYSNS